MTMVAKLKIPALCILFSMFSCQLVAQNKIDKCLQKINLLNKTSRIWFLGKSVNEIYLNRNLKKIDVDGCTIPLEKIELNYTYSGHWESAKGGVSVKKYHGVELSCISGNCLSVDDGSLAFVGTQPTNRESRGLVCDQPTKKKKDMNKIFHK